MTPNKKGALLIAATIAAGVAGVAGSDLLKKKVGPSIVEVLEEKQSPDYDLKEISIEIDKLYDETFPLNSQGNSYKYVIIGHDSTGTRYKYATFDYADVLSRLVKEGEISEGSTLIFRGRVYASDLEKAANDPEYVVPVTHAGIRQDGINPLTGY